MPFRFAWLNCLWLMLPLLAWNLIYGSKITDPRLTSDAHSPTWLLIAENISRILLFVLPLLLPLQVKEPASKAGLIIYTIGVLIYFATWLPFLFDRDSAWRNSTLGLLAPRLTPFLPFLGIAMIGKSLPYGVLAVVFVLLHTWHGIQNL